MISLTKVGNIKIGKVRNGKPIATEKILVTRATKENEENFQILEGFDKNGLDELEVKLVFDDVDLNFEVQYVGFVIINDVEYILKAKKVGEPIIAYPLNPEDFNKKKIYMGTFELGKFNMELTGLLRVMINKYSSFGEVFYFKTHSINSIRAIKDQLNILSEMTGGYLANLPLILKPVKKDVNGNQIVFLSIGFKQEIFADSNNSMFGLNSTLENYIRVRKDSLVNIKALEEEYKNSRKINLNELILISDLVNPDIKVENNSIAEIVDMGEEQTKTTNEKDAEFKEYVEKIFSDNKITNIPLPVAISFLKKVGKREFKKYFKENENIELKNILQLIKG